MKRVLVVLFPLCLFLLAMPVHAFEYRLGIVYQGQKEAVWRTRWKEATSLQEVFDREITIKNAPYSDGLQLSVTIAGQLARVEVRGYRIPSTEAGRLMVFQDSKLVSIRTERFPVWIEPFGVQRPLAVHMSWDFRNHSSQMTEKWRQVKDHLLDNELPVVDGVVQTHVGNIPYDTSDIGEIRYIKASFHISRIRLSE